ncbi:hypothetical protein J6590_097233 [Homalodisca vitripennis]|nr:hypothetical protein J6590_097233 [Homalodisca vitripennis]
MFEFLQTLIPAQIAGGVLAGGLILGGIVYVHGSRRGSSVNEGGTEPATSVVYFNEQCQSETSSSSDSEIEGLPALEHIEDAVGRLEGKDNPEASMTAMAGSIERL